MKLPCAIVRGAGSASSVDIDALVRGVGSAFPVEIDAGQLVGDLKDVIKAKNTATITCDAKDLQLFRTDTKGEWLTEADVQNGVATAELTPLKTAGAPLNLYKLKETTLQVEITDPGSGFAGDNPLYSYTVMQKTNGSTQGYSHLELQSAVSWRSSHEFCLATSRLQIIRWRRSWKAKACRFVNAMSTRC